jgi:hypothetical protein
VPFYRAPGLGLVHMKIGGKDRAPPCRAPFEWQHQGVTHHHCCRPSGFACDAPVGDRGETCDMPLCEDHAKQIGKDRHLCPKHAAEAPQTELF